MLKIKPETTLGVKHLYCSIRSDTHTRANTLTQTQIIVKSMISSERSESKLIITVLCYGNTIHLFKMTQEKVAGCCGRRPSTIRSTGMERGSQDREKWRDIVMEAQNS